MKFIIYYAIIFVILISGCKALNCPEKRKSNSKKIELNIYNSSWFTRTEKSPEFAFADVNLVISGKTNAERLTVRTFGDGKGGDMEIKLDSNGIFNDTIRICFCHDISSSELSKVFYSETNLKAYLDSDKIDTTLNSGPLHYY